MKILAWHYSEAASRSQIFSKTIVFKIFAIFVVKHLEGRIPRFSERGEGALYFGQHGFADDENFRFQMVWKGLNNARNYTFLVRYFYQYFQIFSIFIYNERLTTKSFLQNLQPLWSGKRENTYAAVIERKNEKSWTLFYSRFFYKAL